MTGTIDADRSLEILELNEMLVQQRFAEIVSNISDIEAIVLTPEEKEDIERTPVCKEEGISDQGYRFN